MRQYTADAFTDRIFSGNSAAVCVLDKWPDEKTMMNIAAENNLSETAFPVRENEKYHLRGSPPLKRRDFAGTQRRRLLLCFSASMKSSRKWVLYCTLMNKGRIKISGKAVLYSVSDLNIP